MHRDDPWYLIEAGKLREAVRAFTKLATEDEARPSKYNGNLGIAYLCLGDPGSALPVLDSLLEAPTVSTADYAMSGIARWLLGKPEDAAEFWKKGMGCQYADAAGGMELPLLLYFAGVKGCKASSPAEAKKLLTKAVKHPWADCWPGPLGRFVLGKMTESETKKAAEFDVKEVSRHQVAQVDFYVGVKRLETGDKEGYLTQMRLCASVPNWHIENEYYLARYEATN